MIEDVLKEIGLRRKEIAIYLALLPLGNAPASILGRHTNITRSTAQYTCQQLEKKGLVTSVFKKNTYYYTPESPDKLQYILDKKIKEIQNSKEELNRISGDLIGMMNPQLVLPKLRFYEGVDGLIDMFEDELKDKGPLYSANRIGKNINPDILRYMNNQYILKRKQIKKQSWAFYNDTPESKQRMKNDKEVNRITMLVPMKYFPFDSCCHIYANKIAFYSWHKTDMTGVIIENERIQNTQFSFYKLAWNYARTLKINQKYKNVEIK